uniref:Uncharacterized protein n=1 Tax=Geospiza parvula TaxID=87175 RepID=A0A8C3NLD8_GEOPR
MDGSTLPAVAEELLREIKKAFQETSQVPDDLLLGLKFIFGPSAVPALDLVDQRSVTRLRSPSGRILYQVLGSSGKLYTCYSSCHFCTCPAFGFSVLQKSESLLVSSVPQPGAAMGRGQGSALPLEPQISPQTRVELAMQAEPDHCVTSGSPRVWVQGAGRALGGQQWWGGHQELCASSLHGTVLVVAELGTLSTTCARREPRSWGAEHCTEHILARMDS